MKAKWTEFDKLGYECSRKVYRTETKMDEFSNSKKFGL